MIVTTLSMVVTFIFHYCLEGTSLNSSLFEDTFIDPMRDYLLFIRCTLDSGQSTSSFRKNIFNHQCIYSQWYMQILRE